MNIEKPMIMDLLDINMPALSATSDMPAPPVIETRPDATNEGKPPEKAEAKPDTKDAAPPKEGKKPAESAPAETPAEPAASDLEGDDAEMVEVQAEPAKKPAKGVQKRLDELTRQREDERRAREATEGRLDRALAALERLTGKPAADAKDALEALEVEDAEPTRPERQTFPDTDAFTSALMEYADKKAEWTARREVKAIFAANERKATENAVAQEQERTRNTYRERVEKALEKYPDFKEVAESPDVAITIPMAHAIMHSEHGPDIQYHLGSNPDEAKRISQLPAPSQLVELGLIVAKLTDTPRTEAVAEVKAAAAEAHTPAISTTKPDRTDNVSKSPPPPKFLKGGGTTAQKDPSDMSMEEYAAYRKPSLNQRGMGQRH